MFSFRNNFFFYFPGLKNNLINSCKLILIILNLSDIESNLDRPWVNLGKKYEEDENEENKKIPFLSPFVNVHKEDLSSFPKVFLRINFSDMMNRPICDIKEEKTKNFSHKNFDIFGEYLCEGMLDSITVVSSESNPPNMINGTPDDRALESSEVERGCMYVSYTLTANYCRNKNGTTLEDQIKYNKKENKGNQKKSNKEENEREEETENRGAVSHSDISFKNNKVIMWDEDDTLCLIAVSPPSSYSSCSSSYPSSSSSYSINSNSENHTKTFDTDIPIARTLYTSRELPYELYEYTEEPRKLPVPPHPSSSSSSASISNTASNTASINGSETSISADLHGYACLPLPTHGGWFAISYVRTYIAGASDSVSNKIVEHENNVAKENDCNIVDKDKTITEKNGNRFKSLPAVIVRERVELGRSAV